MCLRGPRLKVTVSLLFGVLEVPCAPLVEPLHNHLLQSQVTTLTARPLVTTPFLRGHRRLLPLKPLILSTR